MRWKFVNLNDLKERERVKRLFNYVKHRPAKDLLVKVINCQPYRYKMRGHFKNIIWSWYQSEDKYRKSGISRVITLKIPIQKATDEEIIGLISHEWRHYLQSRSDTKIGKKLKGRMSEKDAKNYKTKVIEKWKAEQQKGA